MTAEDFEAPRWATITAPDPDPDAPFENTAYEDDDSTTQPSTRPRTRRVKQPKPQSPKRPKQPSPWSRPKPSTDDTKPPTKVKRSANGGGRWKIKLFRGTAYTIMGLMMFGGLKNMVSDTETPDVKTLTGEVSKQLGETGFPKASAEAFAVRFTREFLTYSPTTGETRAAALAAFSPEAADGTWGWDGQGSQSLIGDPVVAAPTDTQDAHYGAVTVAAQLANTSWIALSITIYASKSGALVVAGPPAFVALPTLAANPGKPPEEETDSALSDELQPVMDNFMSAWAASDADVLDRLVAPKGASVQARTGLRGAVTLVSVDLIRMPDGGNKRTGRVDVIWAIPRSGSYTQSYLVTVTKDAEGVWSVADIDGGVLSEQGSDAGTDSPAPDPSTQIPAPPQGE